MTRQNGDIKTLRAMVGIYCGDKHGRTGQVCPECLELLDYAVARLEKCPFADKKPACSRCTVHCYKPAMRARVREVMKYAGPRMLTAHPVLAARHILQGVLRKPGRRVSGES